MVQHFAGIHNQFGGVGGGHQRFYGSKLFILRKFRLKSVGGDENGDDVGHGGLLPEFLGAGRGEMDDRG